MASPTASAFGEPTYDDPNGSPQPSGDGGQAQYAPIDPNDPRLTSEVLDDNLAADAYETPPPPPDGKWRAKLKAVDIKGDDGKPHPFICVSRPGIENGQPFFAMNVECSLIDLSGRHDGVKLTEYWVKSNIDQRRGTSQMSTLVQKAGGTLPAKSSQLVRKDALAKVLAGEPEVIVETAWEAQCQNCQESAKKRGEKAPRPFQYGMHRFPATRTPGVHDPMIACPTCRSLCRAQVRIVQYFNVKEAKPTRGVS